MAVGCGVKSVGGCKHNCVGTGSGLYTPCISSGLDRNASADRKTCNASLRKAGC